MRALLILLLILTSCGQRNILEYEYVETYMKTDQSGTTPQEAKPWAISAISDSDAYVKAYLNFCLSKRFYNEEFQKSGTLAGKPLSFKIFNEKGKDITRSISFLYKDSLEKKIEKQVDQYQPDKE